MSEIVIIELIRTVFTFIFIVLAVRDIVVSEKGKTMRLIDADALCIPPEEINAKMAVACAPTINAVPVKHGEWIYTKKLLAMGGYVDASECSICHKLIMPHLKPNYCPNCGSKMDKVEE